MKVYVDAWIYVTEKFVNVGNIELYEEISRYEKADYPPIPNFIYFCISLKFSFFQGGNGCVGVGAVFLLETSLQHLIIADCPFCHKDFSRFRR